MAKKTATDDFQKLPEKEVKKKSKKDEIQELADKIKSEYGIDVTPTKGNVRYKLKSMIDYLNEHYQFKYNEITYYVEFAENDSDKFVEMETWDINNLVTELGLANHSVGKDKLLTLITSKYVCKRYNPYTEYLYSLPKWDEKTDWIEIFLNQIKLYDEGPEERKELIDSFKKWFVALVGSLIDDRTVNQHCFVLTGGQGRFKTTFLNNIVPKHLSFDYSYSNRFDFGNKDHMKYLATMIMINLDEMTNFSKTDTNILKSVIVDTKVTVRLPYDRSDTKAWRRASFCGSTNNPTFLFDETGNRRFLVFRVKDIELDTTFDLGLIYAQALQLFRNGYQYWFDKEGIDNINKRNEEFFDVSIEQDLIQEYLTIPSEMDIQLNNFQYRTATSINCFLAGKSNRINVNEVTKRRIGLILAKLGYKQAMKRVQGYKVPIRCWMVRINEGTIPFVDESGNKENGESLPF